MPDISTEIHETANSRRNDRNHTERPGLAGTQAGTGLRSVCSDQQGGTGYRNRIDNYSATQLLHTLLHSVHAVRTAARPATN